MKEAIKLVANNKKAYHDYFIDEKFECGIELFGTCLLYTSMGGLFKGLSWKKTLTFPAKLTRMVSRL